MNLNWSLEQLEFRSTLRRLFATSSDSGFWSTMAASGLLGLTIEESLGGSGAGPLEDLILFEEAGRALVADPLFATVALVAPLLTTVEDASDLVAPMIAGDRIYCLAWAGAAGRYSLDFAALAGEFAVDQSDGGVRLSGVRRLVPGLLGADAAVVLTPGPAVYLVPLDAAGIERRDRAAIDESHALGDLTLHQTSARLLLRGEAATVAVRSTFSRAITLAAAETIGIAEAVLALAQTHACERAQFGRPIGSFQAVAHPLANLYADIEMTRSLALFVACRMQEDTAHATEVAALAVAAGTLGLTACETAIQIHGGMGMTWESPLHRYYKRARYLRTLMGSPDAHRALIADHLSSSPLA
jgi:alkylation response protein AidB-like acyl-CoA dehydrogenase